MTPKLSILIATTKARNIIIQRLLKTLNAQIKMHPDEVELIINHHETDNVGKKRNDLLLQAKGEWVVFVDSDDIVSTRYVQLILQALRSNPDCVGIAGVITTNGRKKKKWFISKDYSGWYEKDNVYYRTPNHISPVRREIALKAMFPQIKFGEDAEYSQRILPFIRTEVKIKEEIYHYDYQTVKK